MTLSGRNICSHRKGRHTDIDEKVFKFVRKKRFNWQPVTSNSKKERKQQKRWQKTSTERDKRIGSFSRSSVSIRLTAH